MADAARWHKGTLVLWNDDRGFGFVRPDHGGEDFFIHITAFRKGTTRRPEIGDHVHYQIAQEVRAKKRIAYAVLEGVPVQQFNQASQDPRYRLRRWLIYIVIRLPFLLSCWVLWKTRNPIPLFLYVFLSTLTILFYGADKKRALRNRWRIPESYLHLLELLGGWPGALLAQQDFRHKLTKGSYQKIFWGIVALHGLVWVVLFFYDFSLPKLWRAVMS
jgi:uncharacterized membrane protein YsdA (DUF1294 family)/cold shock CspA family protein